MKKLAVSCLSLLFITNLAFSQEVNRIKIASELERVTVFLTGGEEHRTATVNVKKGRNQLVFTGISTVADHKSVQFNADQEFNLVSVSAEIDYLSFVDDNPRIKTIQDSLKTMREKVIDLQNEKDAYEQEKMLLQQNTNIKGTNQNLSVDELKNMATFYRTRTMELNKIITNYYNDISTLNSLIHRYQNQLSELNYKETIKSNQIIVLIDMPEATALNIDLKYIVSNCGWQANYDLSADNSSGGISLKYKAKVFNNTGNDWNDVNMVLSTSDPNVSASAPTLEPWYLNYNSMYSTNDYNNMGNADVYVAPQKNSYTQYSWNANIAPEMNQNLNFIYSQDNMTEEYRNDADYTQFISGGVFAAPTVSFTTIEVSQLTTEFTIELKYTIPSDSKPYLVDITTHNLQASFSHKAVPKLDKDAFLLANIVGWEKLDLVPGPTNVYFAETYVGQSYINTANVGDTLRLSFGRDNKIDIQRRLLEEFSDKKVIGPNRKDSYTYEIKIKNNRETPVTLNMFDQVPISQDSDITVTVDDISLAEHNLTTGQLMWNIKLNPGESATYRVAFTIKYPKDRDISVKTFRTVACPSF
jgi:hypothetical protein